MHHGSAAWRAVADGVSAYRSAQVRAADAALIAAGVEGYELMCRAALAALRELRARWPVARDLLVLCGGGNNAGDGYALARLAKGAGLSPRVVAVVAPSTLRGDAARAAHDCLAAGVPVLEANGMGEGDALERLLLSELTGCDVLIDALLGIGLVADVRGVIARTIAVINQYNGQSKAQYKAQHHSNEHVGVRHSGPRRPVVALDIPSGLCADTGVVRGTAVHADLTVTFILHKAGLFLGQGPTQAGEIVLARLDADPEFVGSAAGSPVLRLLENSLMARALPARRRTAHKGEGGHVLVIGGGRGMPGAARLAGEAALRAGAGRVTVLAEATSVGSIAAGCAELMVRALVDVKEISTWIETVDVLVLGPGLGVTEWAQDVYGAALEAAQVARRATVIDADALNLLAMSQATKNSVSAQPTASIPCVLTPHPGEAARLLGVDTATVQMDRLSALANLQASYRATIVLKGAGSLVSPEVAREPPWLCTAGNPAMAAPGMGDVLTGVIAALLAQGAPPASAARLGVLWHALAGDAAIADTSMFGADRGLLAGELSRQLPRTSAQFLT